MENILNLSIKIEDNNIDKVVNEISNNLGTNWTRDIATELSLEKVGSKQVVLRYTNGNVKNIVSFIQIGDELSTTNVVPVCGIRNKISIKECNNTIKKLEEDVLNNIDVKYSIHN
jgi:hypothetical protein